MKKTLSIILRILVALAGIGYIAYMIDWTNKVEVPAGAHTTDAGQVVTLDKARAFPVISAEFDPSRLTQPVVVDLALKGQSPQALSIAPELLGEGVAESDSRRFILRPGIVTTLKHANLTYLLLGLLIIAPIYPITALRWWMLLKTRGLEVPAWKAFRLCMVGCFFNYCMPGSTGGDVVKAYYAAKNSDRRADAVMTVIIDRVVGLLGLFVLAGLAGLFVRDAGTRVFKVKLFVWGVAAVVVLSSALYYSRRLRRLSGLDWLLAKTLPREGILAKIDRAAAAYSYHKGTVLLSILASLPVHFLLAVSTALAGHALGIKTPFDTLLTVIPVLFLVMAIPISPQGVGTVEVVAFALLLPHAPGTEALALPNQVVVMLVMARLYQLLYSLTGSVFLLRGDIHMHPPPDPAVTAGSDSQPA